MKVKPCTDNDHCNLEGAARIVGYSFWCPGCQQRHNVTTGWSFNGNMEQPTFQPSILVRGGHYARTPPVPGECYCDYHERYPNDEPMPKGWCCFVCHSFITSGMIQFLGDCTHPLAGKTVPLPDIPERSEGS